MPEDTEARTSDHPTLEGHLLDRVLTSQAAAAAAQTDSAAATRELVTALTAHTSTIITEFARLREETAPCRALRLREQMETEDRAKVRESRWDVLRRAAAALWPVARPAIGLVLGGLALYALLLLGIGPEDVARVVTGSTP